MTVVSMNYLLEAGVQFGHQNDIYIIDLQKTVKKLEEAYEALKAIAEKEGKVLFVGTKKQAQEAAEESAVRTNMYFVNERWLGGTLTNFKTIRSRIRRMEEIEKMETDGTFEALPKKEVIQIRKEYDKLNKNLRGIREMKRMPQAMVIVDPRKEEIAIKEARILGIPVFGIVDTNCDPDMVDYVIPGNDDAVRSVKLLIGALTNAIAEVNGNEIIDYISDEDKNKNDKKAAKKEAVKEEIVEKVKEKKEEVQAAKEEIKEEVEEKKATKKAAKKAAVDLAALSLAELKEKAKESGIKGYSTKKKAELIELIESALK